MPRFAVSDLVLHCFCRCPTKRTLGIYGLMNTQIMNFILTLILPNIICLVNIVCVLHLLHIFTCTQKSFHHESKHYEPRSDCSLRSSLIGVHIVCNIGYQSTQAYERADNIICCSLYCKLYYSLQYRLPKYTNN